MILADVLTVTVGVLLSRIIWKYAEILALWLKYGAG